MEAELMKIAQELGNKEAHASLKALITICSNLSEHPKEERYRTLRTTNVSVLRTIMREPSAIELLEKIGFVEVDGYLSLIGSDPHLYRTAVAVMKVVLGHNTSSSNQNSDFSLSSHLAQTPELQAPRKENEDPNHLSRPPSNLKRVISPQHNWSEVIDHKIVKNQLQGLPPFGECILVYGANGSGKTICSHAAAQAWGLRVFTIYGSEVHSPFAKNRTGTLRHYLRHAQEVSPCLVLLRGMDAILSDIVEEVKLEFLQFPASKLVVMALCTSTDSLIKESHRNLPRVSPNRLLKSMAAANSKTINSSTNGISQLDCQPPIVNTHQQVESVAALLFRDQLSCFDMLVHVPLLQDPSSIALLLQRQIEKMGGSLPSSVSRMICAIISSERSPSPNENSDDVLSRGGGGGERQQSKNSEKREEGGLSGHFISKVANTCMKIARDRKYQDQNSTTSVNVKSIDIMSTGGAKKVIITSDVLREAFEKCR
jgi:hypothetical protein